MTKVLKLYVLIQEKEDQELCMLLQVFFSITVTAFMKAKCTACLTEEINAIEKATFYVGKIQSSN